MLDTKVFIFDFDGTIADTLRTGVDIYNKIAEEKGFGKVNEENVEKLRDMSVREVAKELGISLLQIPRVAVRIRSELKREISRLNMFSGMREMLGELKKRGAILGILSSNSEENVRAFLSHHDIEMFDYVESESNIFGKGGALKHLMKKHHLDPSGTMFIGDEVRDVEAARENGVKSVAVTWGANSKKALKAAKPDFVIDKPKELVIL